MSNSENKSSGEAEFWVDPHHHHTELEIKLARGFLMTRHYANKLESQLLEHNRATGPKKDRRICRKALAAILDMSRNTLDAYLKANPRALTIMRKTNKPKSQYLFWESEARALKQRMGR